MPGEITLPDAKPAFEWIFDRAIQKMSPKRDHAIVQGAFLTALGAWAEGRGEVGPEWRFRVTPPGGATRLLVPDVAYVADARLSGMTHDEKQEPAVAPNVVVEVRSPSDRQAIIDEKVRVYLAAGSDVVILTDPQAQTVIAYDARGSRTFAGGDVFAHHALPGFALPLGPLFAKVRS